MTWHIIFDVVMRYKFQYDVNIDISTINCLDVIAQFLSKFINKNKKNLSDRKFVDLLIDQK